MSIQHLPLLRFKSDPPKVDMAKDQSPEPYWIIGQ